MLFERTPPSGGLLTTQPKSPFLAFLRLLLRYVQRLVIMAIMLGFTVFFVVLISDDATRRGQQSQFNAKLRVDHLVMTLTKTHTDIRKTTTTETVCLPSEPSAAAVPELSSGNTPLRPRDSFGFPIYEGDEDPPHRSVSEDAPTNHHHFYRSDGLLEVNPNAPHPIFELIQRAKRDWEAKHKRASTTLKQACIEYKRRYGREPPPGFQRWWAYVKKHNVQLPDEYDQINRDIEPFWAVDPLVLVKIQKHWESRPDSFTVGKANSRSPFSLLKHTVPEDERMRQELVRGGKLITDLLQEIEEELPVFRAVFSPHDNPSLLSEWDLRQEAKELTARGLYIDLSYPRDPMPHGWKTACPPDSPIWTHPLPASEENGVTSPPTLRQLEMVKFQGRDNLSLPDGAKYPKTFIHDHAATLSPCEHPANIALHGQFLSFGSWGPGPVRERLRERDEENKLIYAGIAPLFSYSPTSLHDDITTAVPLGWVEDIYPREDDPPFDEKPDFRLHWRGRNTGMWCGNDDDVENLYHALRRRDYDEQYHVAVGPDRSWWLSHRQRLVAWANRLWEDRYELDPETTRTPHIGVPHEIWRRWHDFNTLSDRDGASGITMGNDWSLHPSRHQAGVLRSPPSAQHPLLDIPGSTKHESAPPNKAEWAPAMCDIGFVTSPLNCDSRMCDMLRDMYEFRGEHDNKQQGRYKFIIDVDGNGWSSRFKRLMTTNSLIFKATVYPEWFTDRIQPWVHYVPIQIDYSDLLDTLYFFRGDAARHNHHLPLASKMAGAGREWSKNYWRQEDMTAYMYRLFLEYARVMGDENGERKSYTYRESDESTGRAELRDELWRP